MNYVSLLGFFDRGDAPLEFLIQGKGFLKSKQTGDYVMLMFSGPLTGGASSLVEVPKKIFAAYSKAPSDCEYTVRDLVWKAPQGNNTFTQFKINSKTEFKIPSFVETAETKTSLIGRAQAGYYKSVSGSEFAEWMTQINVSHEVSVKVCFIGVTQWFDQKGDLGFVVMPVVTLGAVHVTRSFEKVPFTEPEEIIEC